MTPDPDPAARRALQSLMGFWAEAGVDAAYAEAPVDRLAPPPRRPDPPRPLAPPRHQAARPIPADLDAALSDLRAHAAEAADLPALLALAEARATSGALLLQSVEAPLVAWIVAAPDADDLAAGRLLAGPRGRLFARMMGAIGLEGRVVVAAAAPAAARLGGGPDVAAASAHAVLLERALQLVAPQIVVAAGADALRALTGEDAPILKAHGRLRDWTGPHFGLALPLMPTFSLETLLAQPPAKARAWRDILTLRARVDSVTPAP